MELKDFEKNIGYIFKDKELLRLALTHSSYANERMVRSDNERLEFLGDSVLGFITAEYLFQLLPTVPRVSLQSSEQMQYAKKALLSSQQK